MAEMRETRRQIESQEGKMPDSKEASKVPAQWQHAIEAYNGMLESFTKNFHELEQSLADKVSVSKKRLNQWRSESRILLKQLSEMSQIPALEAGA